MPSKTPPTTHPGEAESVALAEIRATRMAAAARLLLPAAFLLVIASVLALLASGQAAAPLPNPLQAGFEEGLEKASPWRSPSLEAAWALLRPLGAAAENAFQGRDRWLFYRPDVEHLTGPPFDPQPPIEAIAQLDCQLRARGIQLVVLPTPVKPSIYPEKLSMSATSVSWPSAQHSHLPADAVRSPSFRRFIRELRSRGLDVVDIAPSLVQARPQSENPLYLATDTHWSPTGLEIASPMLAQAVTRLIGPGSLRYRRTPLQVAALGDTARLFHHDSRDLSQLETVVIQQVANQQGHLWRPEPAAPIVLLGDSFSNIYTLGGMGWGTSAGLAAQLSFHSGHPVDSLVQNDQAATAPRRLLAELSSGLPAPETRLVVYQFAARELSFGDWEASLPP